MSGARRHSYLLSVIGRPAGRRGGQKMVLFGNNAVNFTYYMEYYLKPSRIQVTGLDRVYFYIPGVLLLFYLPECKFGDQGFKVNGGFGIGDGSPLLEHLLIAADGELDELVTHDAL